MAVMKFKLALYLSFQMMVFISVSQEVIHLEKQNWLGTSVIQVIRLPAKVEILYTDTGNNMKKRELLLERVSGDSLYFRSYPQKGIVNQPICYNDIYKLRFPSISKYAMKTLALAGTIVTTLFTLIIVGELTAPADNKPLGEGGGSAISAVAVVGIPVAVATVFLWIKSNMTYRASKWKLAK